MATLETTERRARASPSNDPRRAYGRGRSRVAANMTPNVSPAGGLPPSLSNEANVIPYLNARSGWSPSIIVTPGGGPGGDGGDYGSNTPNSATQGINEALQSCAKAGGVVVVQAGNYALKGTLTIPSNVALVLQGATLTAGVSLPNMIVFKNNASLVGYGTIDGNRLAGTIVYMATGGRLVGFGGVLLIQKNAFGQKYFCGINISNCTDVEVSHLSLFETSIGVNGLIRGSFTDLRVTIATDLAANVQNRRPIYVVANAGPTSFLKFSRVHVDGGNAQSETLMAFDGGEHGPITNCSVSDCSWDNALANSVADGLDVVGCDGVTVTGCVTSRVCDGISVCGASNVTLVSNVARMCSASGLSLGDGSIVAVTKRLMVTGNVCVSNGTKPGGSLSSKTGIAVISAPGSTTSDIMIVGNICVDEGKGIQLYGVYIDTIPSNVYTNANHLRGNGTAGYHYAGANATVTVQNNLI